MAEKIGEVFVEGSFKSSATGDIVTELKKIQGLLGGVAKQAKKTETGFKKLSSTIKRLAIGALITKGFKEAVTAASDLNEQTSKFGVTFRDVIDDANKASKELNESFGLSKRESQEFLSTTGDLVTGLGFTQKASLDLAAQLNKLAIDVTSFKNVQGGVTQTTRAFNSAILGEREALKSLGFSLTEQEVKDRLFQKGQDKSTGAVLRQNKALATIELITEKNRNAVGDFNRTQDQFANVSRRVTARLEDLAAVAGAELTPALAELGVAFLQITEDGELMKDTMKVVKFTFDVLTSSIFQSFTQLAAFQKKLKELQGLTKEDILANMGESALEVAKNTKFIVPEIKRVTKATRERIKAQREFARAFAKAQEEAQKAISEFGLNEIELLRKQGADKNAEINAQLAKRLITEEQANSLKIINEVNVQKQITAIQKAEQDKRAAQLQQSTQLILSATSGFIGQLGALFAQSASNRISILSSEQEQRLQMIDEAFEMQLEREGLQQETDTEKAENEILSLQAQLERTVSIRDKIRLREEIKEKTQAQKLAQITADKTKKEQETVAAFEKQKRKIQRESAEIGKKIAIAQVLFETPLAAMRAYSSAQILPPPSNVIVGTTMAGIATALGFAKLALIQQTPLPPLQRGGAVGGSVFGTPVIIGDQQTPEAILPLTRTIFDQLGQGVVTALVERQNQIESGTTGVDEVATIEPAGDAPTDMHLTINVLDEVFFTKIEDAITNREITIDLGGLVTK